jgi:transposase
VRLVSSAGVVVQLPGGTRLEVPISDPRALRLVIHTLARFVNRRGDRIKAMWWDRDGLALFYKRLESGTFEMLKPEGEAATVEIDAAELAMLLSGVSLESAKRRKRYSRAG